MSEGDQVIYVESGGFRRRYVLHTPPAHRPERWPLVVMLDGRGGTPWTAIKITNWSRKADESGFLVAYPEALKLDPDGPQHFLTNPQMWNAGSGGSDVERSGPDDVQFLADVLDDIAARLPVDPDRVYMTGFSNGASMTFRFALEQPQRLAAIAPVSGHCRFAATSTLPAPIPMIYCFGELDTLSPFHGGEVELPWGQREYRPPARYSVDAWVRLLGLPADPSRETSADGITTQVYGPRADGAEVHFHAVADLGHVWPGGHRLLPEKLVGPESHRLIANDAIWDFFAARPRRVRP